MGGQGADRMSEADVIRRRGRPYTVQRPTVTYTDGYALPGTPVSLTIFAHVQTLSGEELRNLPPGQNSSDYRIVWSLNELNVRDIITIDAETYTVQRVSPWPNHWQGVVTKVRDTL